MGVPRLFPWVKEKYGKYIFTFKKPPSPSKGGVDYLYMDGNAFIHPEAQRVFGYGGKVLLTSPFEHLTFEDKKREVFSGVLEAIKRYVHIVKPKIALYFSVDGAPPFGKISQQRQRRFEPFENKDGFHSASISPGTQFEKELTEYLSFALRREMSVNPNWRSFDVIFSSPYVSGEGEAKILTFIKSLPMHVRMMTSHCICSPDADLIFLTMTVSVKKMLLLREDQFNPGDYHLLNMTNIRSQMIKDKLNIDNIQVIGFFVGNDFLPKIKMFYQLKDGLNFILSASESSKIIKSGEIDYSGFKNLVKKLAFRESPYISEQAEAFNKQRYKNKKLEDKTLKSCIAKGKLDFKCYQKKYYKKMNIDYDSEKDKISELCRDYTKTIIWNFLYYVKSVPDWRWSYNYDYAPFMRDLYYYLDELKENEFNDLKKFELHKPLPIYAQLMSILPRELNFLLPEQFRKIVMDSDLDVYYPKHLEKDFEGVQKEWMAHLHLPFIKPDLMLKKYNSVDFKEDFPFDEPARLRYDPKIDDEYLIEKYKIWHNHTKEVDVHLESGSS